MAYVPGTEIEKPSVEFSATASPFEKLQKCQRALRRARCPEAIVDSFKAAAVAGNLFQNVDTAVTDYVEVAS